MGNESAGGFGATRSGCGFGEVRLVGTRKRRVMPLVSFAYSAAHWLDERNLGPSGDGVIAEPTCQAPSGGEE
jgi:hypothetical protein